MISAALDTSHGATLAIANAGELLFEAALPTCRRQDDRDLAAWVRSGLAAAGVTARAVQRWTVGTGPGSFSGVRTGIALVEGICAVSGASCRGIPSSVALALALGESDPRAVRLGVLQDGRCGQVIISRFHCHAGVLQPSAPAAVVDPATLATAECGCERYVTAQLAAIEALLPAAVRHRTLGLATPAARYLLAPPGWDWPADALARAASLEPVYVRPPVFVAPRPERQVDV